MKSRRVVVVLHATLDDMAMDCCDDDRVHVWLYCMEWSGRRAFVTQGSQFLAANGGGEVEPPTEQTVEALRGAAFYAEFALPPFEPDSGERIWMHNIVKCPPTEEVWERLRTKTNHAK